MSAEKLQYIKPQKIVDFTSAINATCPWMHHQNHNTTASEPVTFVVKTLHIKIIHQRDVGQTKFLTHNGRKR